MFCSHIADKYGYLGPFDHNGAQPKIRQKGEVFFDDTCGIAQNLTLMYCLSTYVPEKCLVFNLRSKVELNWTSAIRPVIAQSVQFSNISKKTGHRFVPFFFSSKGSTVLIKIMK